MVRALFPPLLVLAAASSCFTPQAILPGGQRELDPAARRFPPGTERVEVSSGTNVLRGVWVPSDPGAPVVLHLLESSGSVTGFLIYTVFRELAQRGFASLALDYSGVGASGGQRSPSNLRRDARAAWEEALRRAGGDPERVVVRAISIGGLAAGTLLESGIRPGALVLHAPVRAETVAKNFAFAYRNDVLAFLVTPFLRPALDIDLLQVLACNGAPTLVFGSFEDELLRPREAQLVRAAVEGAGGEFVREELDHVWLTIQAHGLPAREAAFLRARFPDVPPPAERLAALLARLEPALAARFSEPGQARERLVELARTRRFDEPGLLAGVALSSLPLEGVDDWLDKDLAVEEPFRPWLAGLELEDLLLVLDLSDPAGELPGAEVCRLVYSLRHARDPRVVQRVCWSSADVRAILVTLLGREPPRETTAQVRERALATRQPVVAWASDFGQELLLAHPIHSGDHPSTWQVFPLSELERELREDVRLDRPAAVRQLARILLKAAGIPDRWEVLPDGTVALEVREDGAWRPFELSGLVPAAP